MPVVESTADIIAIIGAATTLILGVVGGLRYSRCTKISCCWRAFEVEREVPPAQVPPARSETASLSDTACHQV